MKLIFYMWLHILRSNHFTFVLPGKYWFPDDSNHVINGDHNDDNSDNNGNYVDYNDENDVNFMVIMITMVATVMIMKTTMIKIIMVMIKVIMMMVKHSLPISLYTIHGWCLDLGFG